jgi:hypothetical protein
VNKKSTKKNDFFLKKERFFSQDNAKTAAFCALCAHKQVSAKGAPYRHRLRRPAFYGYTQGHSLHACAN